MVLIECFVCKKNVGIRDRDRDYIYLSRCDHIFHKYCLYKANKCPQCDINISVENLEELSNDNKILNLRYNLSPRLAVNVVVIPHEPLFIPLDFWENLDPQPAIPFFAISRIVMIYIQ